MSFGRAAGPDPTAAGNPWGGQDWPIPSPEPGGESRLLRSPRAFGLWQSEKQLLTAGLGLQKHL